MLEYVANLLPRLQQFSRNLTHKEILIDQPWVNIDEGLNKTQYIFRRNGNLIVSVNGDAITGKWEYVAAANSLLIETDKQKLLLNHGFFDKGALILKKDGQKVGLLLANQRIVPDLDIVSYLDRVLRRVTIWALLENKKILESTDPESKDFSVGTKVGFKDEIPADGLYKQLNENKHYAIKNGRIDQILIEKVFKTEKGTLTIFSTIINPQIEAGSIALMNGQPAPDGKYLVQGLEEGIKYIVVKQGRVAGINYENSTGRAILIGILFFIMLLTVVLIIAEITR